MTLTFPRSTHLACTGAALAIALCAPAALAQTPPSDLPPLPQQGSTGAPGTPVTPPGTPVTPGKPGAPPGYVPPGLAWMSPNEVPPGYPLPQGGYAPAPTYQMMQAPVVSDAYRIPPPPPRERRDQGMFVGGIIAVAGGMGVVFTGAYLVSSAAASIDIYCDSPSFPCAHKNDVPRMTGGIILMAAGGLVAAAGVPMWIYGSSWVYKQPDAKKAGVLRPMIGVGPGSATLRFTF